MDITPNPAEKEFADAPVEVANPPEPAFDKDGPEGPLDNRTPEAEQGVDYKEKFSASSREAQRLLEENKREREAREAAERRAEEAEARARGENPQGPSSEPLYTGFEELDPEQQASVLEFARGVEERVKSGIDNDPAISFARRNYNESRFNEALEATLQKFPELAQSKDEFKSKYFQPSNVPDNIEDVLGDLAKVHLFDKSRELGAAEERERAGRIELERAHGGDKPTQHTSRTLEEWQRMQQENPAEFARHAKEYQADLDSGKLAE